MIESAMNKDISVVVVEKFPIMPFPINFVNKEIAKAITNITKYFFLICP